MGAPYQNRSPMIIHIGKDNLDDNLMAGVVDTTSVPTEGRGQEAG